MGEPALNRILRSETDEFKSIFKEKLVLIEKLKKEIQEMNAQIKILYKTNKQIFTDEMVQEFVIEIGKLRKSLKDTELEVQLLNRTIAFGK